MRDSVTYLVGCTRPNLVPRFRKNHGPKQWQALKKVLRYPTLSGWTNPSSILHGWTHSDWGGDVDNCKSTNGYIYTSVERAMVWG